MSEWINSGLDIILIALVGVGLVQASRLLKHLTGLRQGRIEMERFVHEFNATVIRAEAGIKGLRQAARDSGDDLEKLVEKSLLVRDELNFLVDSADKLAERLSQSATGVRPEKVEAKKPESRETLAPSAPVTPLPAARKPESKDTPVPSSRAEKELLQALQKLS